MGSYSTLRVGRLTVDSIKGDIDPAIMMLFCRGDKRILPISLEKWIDGGGDAEDWSEAQCEVKYSCVVANMRDRLGLRGFTREVAEESFQIGAQYRIRELRASVELSRNLLNSSMINDPNPHYLRPKEMERRKIQILETITPEAWVDAIRSIRESPENLSVTFEECAEFSPEEQFVLISRHSGFGFPGADRRCMLRLFLDACPDDGDVSYDLTDLVAGGYFDSASDMIQYAEYLLSREYDASKTTVVLTEGSTDRWILERSMKLLCPHLAPFFSFMDFDGVRLEGGAGSLANIVKAFAGAGIFNRVVALFDNDTAGISALRALQTIALPPNIKVVSLPFIEIGRQYPTLGPTGLSVMDVNGLACGIEMYLGSDSLKGNDGEFVPVQWKGYDPKLRRYQGELLSKGEILERFRMKLKTCESDSTRLEDFDWKGLRLVIDMLRSAFHDEDKSAHLKYENWVAHDK